MIDYTLYTDEQKRMPAGARQFAQNEFKPALIKTDWLKS